MTASSWSYIPARMTRSSGCCWSERAEIGFVGLPAQRPGLIATPLITARTVCVMPTGHPLAAQESVGFRDLKGVPLILLGRTRSSRRDIDELFWKLGISPNIRVEAHSVCSACALAARGLGVTLVNELMALDYAHMQVTVRPLQEVLTHEFAFATAEGIPPSRAAENFIRKTSEVLRYILPQKTETSVPS